ncbi:hypothetical protein COCNU_10G008620 [Cocos nucifera]|uniref:Uncharacterized protein n=1 Tax=Cocos nucifera TaxID=13894 RepID=A0A8K0IP21_COCNU|nr:hypothetical protein COCNU_10G008620 [Cocos nucifera]
MDAQATKMLTKGLFTRKRNGKAQEDGSKRVKVGVSSSEVPTPTIAAFEVIVGAEIASIAKSDHQMLAHIKRVHHQEAEAQKAPEDLRAEVNCLQERVDEVEHLAEEKSPINVDPLHQGVSIKPLIKNLRKKVHLLRKKLKKMEDDLRALQKNASEVMKEVTHLRGLHMKEVVSFSIQKGSFKKEVTKLKKNASDKS